MAYDLGTLFYKITLSNKEFNSTIDDADKRLETFNKKLEKIGKELTSKVTLPILASGTAALKFAADAEVSGRKFEKAFAGSIDKATESVSLLNTEYGLSSAQSKQLLANTGDLLKGFGASADAALDTSLQVQQLAASLSAYNGVPVKQASEAITKALLGETEGLKSLGISLNQTDIANRLLLNGQAELTGQELLLAKASATLELAYSQSTDAVDSFAENSNTLSYTLNQLLGDTKDLGVEFGTVLLPVAKELVGGVRELVKEFSSYDDNTKKTIITIAALAAGIGPAVSGFNNLSKALNAAIANPVIAGLTAISLIVAAMAVNVSLAQDEFEKLNTVMEGGTTGSIKSDLELVNEELEKQKAALGSTSGLIQSEVDAIQTQIDKLEIIKSKLAENYRYEQLNLVGKKEQAKIAEEIAKQEEEKAKSTAVSAKAQELYNIARGKVLVILDSQLSAQGKIQAQIDELQKTPWSKGELEDDRLKAIEILKEQLKDLAETEKEEAEKVAKVKRDLILQNVTDVLSANKSEIQNLQEKYDSIVEIETETDEELLNKKQALALLEKQIYDKEEDEYKQRLLNKISSFESYSNKIFSIANTLAQVNDNTTQKAIDNIETENDYRQTVLDQQIKAIEDSVDSKADLSEEEKQQLKDLENEKIRLNFEAEQAIYKVQLENFKRKQALATAEIAINTGVAITKAFAELGPIAGAISAILLAAQGVAQGAVVYTQVPPIAPNPPVYLANGGIATATNGGINAVIAEAGVDELVAPLTDETFSRLGNAIVESMNATTTVASRNTNGAGYLEINIAGLGKLIINDFQQLLNDGFITVPARSIV